MLTPLEETGTEIKIYCYHHHHLKCAWKYHLLVKVFSVFLNVIYGFVGQNLDSLLIQSFPLCAGLLRCRARRSKLRRNRQDPRSSCATSPSRPLSEKFGNSSGSRHIQTQYYFYFYSLYVWRKFGARSFNNTMISSLSPFSTFGELKTVRLPKKAAGSGNHRGFGFIDFLTKQDAKVCVLCKLSAMHLGKVLSPSATLKCTLSWS